MLPLSALNSVVHNQVVSETVMEKFSLSKLKIKKLTFFTESNQISCISVFNVEGCLVSCLTFGPFLKLDP